MVNSPGCATVIGGKTGRGCRYATIALVALVLGLAVATVVHVRRDPMLRNLFAGGEELKGGLAQLYDITAVPFPAGAELTNSQLQFGQDSALWARIVMPAESVEGLLERLPEDALVSRDDRLGNRGARHLDWWQPDAAKNYVAAAFNSHAADGLYAGWVWLLIDQDDPNTAVVYLEWSGSYSRAFERPSER